MRVCCPSMEQEVGVLGGLAGESRGTNGTVCRASVDCAGVSGVLDVS